jgi:hypothetical protein
MKNTSLNSDLKRLIEEQDNISSIHKGGVNGFSLEITFLEPYSHGSYLYSDEKHRDADFEKLTNLIQK